MNVFSSHVALNSVDYMFLNSVYFCRDMFSVAVCNQSNLCALQIHKTICDK